MFRHALGSLGPPSHRAWSISTGQVRGVSHRTGAGDESLEAEYAEARKWVSDLRKDTVPMSLARVSFARSSGAGGQHVNKTNSKAICAWPMDSITSLVPKILHAELRSSRFYVASSDGLQMSAQTSRSASSNQDECHDKFLKLLRDVSKRVIPGPTLAAQKQKVERMRKADDAARLQMKKKHSAKKQTRSGGGGRDY